MAIAAMETSNPINGAKKKENVKGFPSYIWILQQCFKSLLNSIINLTARGGVKFCLLCTLG